MPQGESIEWQENKQPSNIKKPRSIGVWLISFFFVGAIALTIIALMFRGLASFPAWVNFLTTDILSLLLLIVVIAQAVIYQRQWAAMREQLAAIREQTQSMQDSLTETRSMTEQNRRAVEAAEKGVDIAQQNMIFAQRAYVTITDGAIIRPIRELLFKMTIRNSGNTPAYDVRVARKVDILGSLPDPNTPWETWSRLGVIAPQGRVELLAPAPDSVTDQQNQLIAMGKLKTYCWGIILYKDIFGEDRYTKFCFSDRLGESHFGPCESGNEAN